MITSLSTSLLSDSMVISACFLPLLLEEVDAVEAPLALLKDEDAAARDDFAGESVAVERFFALGADCPAVLSALRFGACVQSDTLAFSVAVTMRCEACAAPRERGWESTP